MNKNGLKSLFGIASTSCLICIPGDSINKSNFTYSDNHNIYSTLNGNIKVNI